MMVLIVTSGPEDHPPCWRGLQMLNAITAGMFTCKSRRTIEGGATQPHELPPPAQMILLLGGFRISQALYAAAVLGVADQLMAGPAPAEVLARRAGAHPPSLHRLLRTLAGAGVFTEPEPGLFALTSLGQTLVSGQPGSMREVAIMFVETHYARRSATSSTPSAPASPPPSTSITSRSSAGCRTTRSRSGCRLKRADA